MFIKRHWRLHAGAAEARRKLTELASRTDTIACARTYRRRDSGATSGGGDLLHFHLFIVGQTDNCDSAPSVPLPSTAAPVQRITCVPTAPHSPGRPPVIVHRHQRGTRVSIAHLASVHRRKAKKQTNKRASTSSPRTQMSHVHPLPKSASTRGASLD